jgi:tetratricopeptide (TPR) repeat protein
MAKVRPPEEYARVTTWKAGQISFKLGSTPPPARDAQADRALLTRVLETAQGGDIDAATGLAETALAGGLEHALLFNLVAGRREAEGRFDDALQLLERAHAISPQDIGVRQALGLLLHRLERYGEALAHFDALVDAQADFGPGHAARGLTLEALGDLRGAGTAYARALELQPGNLAALAGAASLESQLGSHDRAREMAERVLAAAPGYPDAVMTLATADLAQGAPEAAEARLRELAADPRATPQQQALADGLLGDALDAQGRAEEAFAAYHECNARLLDIYRDRFGVGQSALAYTSTLLGVLREAPTGAWSAKAGASTSGASGHVFLLGFFRSGAARLEQALGARADVAMLEAGAPLIDAVRTYARRPEDLIALAGAGEAELAQLREAYWARVGQAGVDPAGKLFIDAQPLNTFNLPLISKLFPDAKLLVVRRDPRDAVLSSYARRFAMSAPAYQLLTLQGAADYYDAAMHLAARVGADFPLEQFVVRHEALVADFETTLREVCGFLGLDWASGMQAAAPVAATTAGLAAETVGHWRWYSDPLAAVQPTLRPWVDTFGYAST